MATTKRRSTAAPKTRTLIITRGARGFGDTPSGRIRLTIPATNKVTFGMMQPGVKGGHGMGEGSTLRIYEGAKQTAVFQNVVEFRDESYPVEVEVIEEATEADVERKDGQVVRASNDRRVDRRFVAVEPF